MLSQHWQQQHAINTDSSKMLSLKHFSAEMPSQQMCFPNTTAEMLSQHWQPQMLYQHWQQKCFPKTDSRNAFLTLTAEMLSKHWQQKCWESICSRLCWESICSRQLGWEKMTQPLVLGKHFCYQGLGKYLSLPVLGKAFQGQKFKKHLLPTTRWGNTLLSRRNSFPANVSPEWRNLPTMTAEMLSQTLTAEMLSQHERLQWFQSRWLHAFQHFCCQC